MSPYRSNKPNVSPCFRTSMWSSVSEEEATIVALIIPTIDVFHESLSSVSDRPAQPASEGGSEKKGRANACYSSRFTKPFCDPAE